MCQFREFVSTWDSQRSNFVDHFPKTLLYGMQIANNGITMLTVSWVVLVPFRALLYGEHLLHLIFHNVVYELVISTLDKKMSSTGQLLFHH